MEFNFGDDPKQDPCLEAAQFKHKLMKNFVKGSERAKLLESLRKTVLENKMDAYANYLVGFVSDFKLSAAEVTDLKKANEKRKTEIETELKDAEENLGEIEVLEAHKKLANFLYTTSTKDAALEAFNKIDTLKGASTGQKIDNNLRKVRLGLFWKDLEVLQVSIEEVERLLEIGGDWERRNRLKVYRGLFNVLRRRFNEAADDFLATMATFTCTELFSYKDFICYAIFTAIVGLNRVDFKQKVIDSTQVKKIYNQVPWLPEFVHTLHDLDYGTFFESLVNMYPLLDQDRFFHDHVNWWVREIRIKTYAQFLQPFKSVTLEMMSYEFGVSQKFLEEELFRFIAAGKLQAKIDKTNGVVETVKQSTTHEKYQLMMKEGDVLLNKIQVLSRLLGV